MNKHDIDILSETSKFQELMENEMRREKITLNRREKITLNK